MNLEDLQDFIKEIAKYINEWIDFKSGLDIVDDRDIIIQIDAGNRLLFNMRKQLCIVAVAMQDYYRGCQWVNKETLLLIKECKDIMNGVK